MSRIVYLNGKLYTMDASRPQAQAMAVERESGRILAIGDNVEVRQAAGSRAELIDLRGKTVLPGFIDAHIHLLATAYRSHDIDAAACNSADEVAQLVRERAARTPLGEWVVGNHWDRNRWPSRAFPTREVLDAAAPEHPVALWSKDGHLLWVNSLALARAGITAETSDPPGGAILRDGSGQPTGILQEGAAMELVARLISPLSPVLARQLLQETLAALLRSGITAIHDIEDRATYDLLASLRAEGRLPLRVRMILQRHPLPELRAGLLKADEEDDLLRIGGIKIFADGTLGSQTAAMLESYEGSLSNYGILATPEEEMRVLVREASELNLLIAIHAIGDRAARVALDAIELAERHLTERGQRPGKRLRYRLEHVQLIHATDLERMHRLGVIASVQPYHAVADRDIAERYWGERHRRAYAYRTMYERGIALALGSDAPVELFDPLRIIYAAVQRTDPESGRPSWLPEQALSLGAALYGYTLGAAYAGAEEADKGSLSVGKFGDAVVLPEDPFQISPERLVSNGIQATIVGGLLVYGEV
ncbi:amidohydrolase [Thermogemmatispora aurantia]|uniref:Amidohydrolase n=1 Tax=Thermogemmatispora aurantia TaxID=2045279 RepID=A0A5J4KHG0_9CHLR|nr:amidohydrolase [Thermogemmatispora aurantia]GER85730.1 amidohydrolase [Thermogemmatispora aurantia]